MLKLDALLNTLNNCYLNNYNTKIIGGFEEPFYQAAIANKPAEIRFTHDYIRSALHELAHWCVAGATRRKQDDYGYWYADDGRNQQQQDEFFKVELKPQAIEWAFSQACGVKFEPSVDNLGTKVAGVAEFNKRLKQQLQGYYENGFSQRADDILKLLSNN